MAIQHIKVEPSFRNCQVCGSATPATVPNCVNCGMPSPEALAAQRDAIATRNFVLTLGSRANPFTMIFIGANAAMFLVEWLAGGMGVMSADPYVLTALGAKSNDLIINGHQYWRLITSIFLHIGFIHVLLNNYALWIIGQEIERIYGSARFVILYTVTGVIASTCSLIFSPNDSAGASGAIFGLFGVMAVFAFRYRKEIPNAIGKSIRSRVLMLIGLNLLIGFQSGIVDNSAHVGGLVSGAALAMLIPYKRPEESSTPQFLRLLQAICLGVILVSLAFAFRNFGGTPLRIANLKTAPTSRLALFKKYFESMEAAFNSFGHGSGLLERSTRRTGDAAVANARLAVQTGLSATAAAPNLGTEAESYRTRLAGILTRELQLIDRLPPADQAARESYSADDERLNQEFGQLKTAFDEWEPEFLRKNGFTTRESD